MSALDVVVLGLSITSSWGNGHATTYRALLRALSRRGHRVLFLERDVPWYADNRDLARPSFCDLGLYRSFEELTDQWEERVRGADAVIVGSYVPEGDRVGEWVTSVAPGRAVFYDIDTPVTLRELADGTCAYLTRALVPRYALYLSFTGGPTLDRIERQFGSPRARALYCCVDADAYQPEPRRPRWDLGYLGTYSADRQPTLDELLIRTAGAWSDGSFVVAGAQYPEGIDWPANVERTHHVPPPRHQHFYCEQRFTLNVTRADMKRAGWSPSVRIFEAAACGTPIVTDDWPGLERILQPGKEILVARSTAEVLSILRDTPELERLAIARRARTRVLSEHTAARRAEALERELEDSLARGTASRGRVPQGGRTGGFMSAHRVLVMGGAGFLGSHLCDALLRDGHEVVAVDDLSTGSRDNVVHLASNRRFTFYEHDVREPLHLPVDRIYNLACPASPPHYQEDPIKTTLTSVLGTLHALELARRSGARVFLASTSEVYGDPDVHPQPETYRGCVNPIGIRACYDEGKRCAESLGMDFLRTFGVPVRIARIFNTYGPRMAPDDGRVVSNFVVQALAGEDLTLYGDGTQTRSFCYVDDLVEGIRRLMESDVIGPVNLGNPQEFTVAELARIVLELTASSSSMRFLPLPQDDPRVRRPDITRARELLRFEPTVPLREGLVHTIASFRERLYSRPTYRELRRAEMNGGPPPR